METRSVDVPSSEEVVVEVVVIGGGSAGLSAALTLARARRSVVVIDAGEPRNGPAAGIHGLLTREGMAPRDLVAVGAGEVRRHGGRVRADRVVSVRRDGQRFLVRTEQGATFTAARLLVATGLVDELPAVAGLRERWGRDVLHCPYCHGWEIRDQPIGVLGSGPGSVHQVLLFRQWSADLTYFVHTAPDVTDEQGEQLSARGVSVVTGTVAGLDVAADELRGIQMTSGEVLPVRALVISPHFVANDAALNDLGLLSTEHPAGMGSHVESDAKGQTAVPGVWVAGNVTDLAAGVVQCAAAGVTAAAAINADLVATDTAEAVQRHRDPFSGPSEAGVAGRVLGDRRHGLDDRGPAPPLSSASGIGVAP